MFMGTLKLDIPINMFKVFYLEYLNYIRKHQNKRHPVYKLQLFYNILCTLLLLIRYRPRFFDQVGHQTTNASIGNKYIVTKSCHHQTYQNYEQSRQKFGTFLVNKVL